MRNTICSAATLILVLGCDATSSPPKNKPTPDPMFQDHWTPVDPADHGPGSLDPVLEQEGKIARRLSVDELRRSIPALFDGITWTVRRAGNDQVAFNALSRTLGEADYVQTTVNNLD